MSESAPGEYFDAVPERAGVRPQSPLHRYGARTQPEAGVSLRERRFRGHLVLRGNPEHSGLSSAMVDLFGLNLPTRPLTLVQSDSISLQWSSPNEWLLIVPLGETYQVAQALRQRCHGRASIVDVSGGQTLVELTGPNVRELLMKSTPCDVDDRVFGPGKAVTTVFAKTMATIRRPDCACWELILRRSYADYLWSWLLDASAEYGVSVLPAD